MRQINRMNFLCAVHYGNKCKVVEIPENKSLLDSLRSKGFLIPFSCGGEGICTTCRILVVEGRLSAQNPLEQKRAKERGFLPEERLSCQSFPLSDLKIKLP